MTPTTTSGQPPVRRRDASTAPGAELRAGDKADILGASIRTACQRRSAAGAPPRVRIRAVIRLNRAASRGLFVTFEGIEGSGKTSQIARAAEWMEARGLPVLATRNPGGTELGKLLRDALLHSRGHIDAGAELLLMMADRRHHLATMIEPALAAGTHVLCDRYTDASRAYQGAGRGLGERRVDALHRAWCRRDPDRTIPPRPARRARARARREAPRSVVRQVRRAKTRNSIERVRAAYRRRARMEPKRFVGHRRVAARRTTSFFHSKKIFNPSSLSPRLPEARVSGAPVVLLAGPGSSRLEVAALEEAAAAICGSGFDRRVDRARAASSAKEHPDLMVAAPERRRRVNAPHFEEGDTKETSIPTALVRAVAADSDAPPLRGADARDRLPRRGPDRARGVQRAPEDPRGAADEDPLPPDGDAAAPPARDDPLARHPCRPMPGTSRAETAGALARARHGARGRRGARGLRAARRRRGGGARPRGGARDARRAPRGGLRRLPRRARARGRSRSRASSPRTTPPRPAGASSSSAQLLRDAAAGDGRPRGSARRLPRALRRTSRASAPPPARASSTPPRARSLWPAASPTPAATSASRPKRSRWGCDGRPAPPRPRRDPRSRGRCPDPAAVQRAAVSRVRRRGPRPAPGPGSRPVRRLGSRLIRVPVADDLRDHGCGRGGPPFLPARPRTLVARRSPEKRRALRRCFAGRAHPRGKDGHPARERADGPAWSVGLARRLGGNRAAVAAGLFLAFCPALVQRSSIVIVDTVAALFTTAALLAAEMLRTAVLDGGPAAPAARRFALAAGALSGLAATAKYPSALVFSAVALAALAGRNGFLERLRLAALATAAAVFAAVIAMPALAFRAPQVAMALVGQTEFYSRASFANAPSLFSQALLPSELGTALVVASTLGLAALLMRRSTRGAALGWILFASLLLTPLALYNFQPFRNTLPVRRRIPRRHRLSHWKRSSARALAHRLGPPRRRRPRLLRSRSPHRRPAPCKGLARAPRGRARNPGVERSARPSSERARNSPFGARTRRVRADGRSVERSSRACRERTLRRSRYRPVRCRRFPGARLDAEARSFEERAAALPVLATFGSKHTSVHPNFWRYNDELLVLARLPAIERRTP